MARKRITSEYGARIHPVTGQLKGHKGIDMAGPEPGMFGYPIYAAKDGVVTIARSLRGYGNVVYMEHEGGYQTRYAHLRDFGVGEGDMVSAGTKIGGMGNTGVGTGPHLHYEVRKDDRPLNPMDVLSARAGAMVTSQSSEFGIPANIHPNEAILPLNDKVLGGLGAEMGKHIEPSSRLLSDYSSYEAQNSNQVARQQMDMNRSFINSTRSLLADVKKSLEKKDESVKEQRSTTTVMNRSIGNNEPPDQIENGLMLILNSSWGVT
jgi:hypothetical protein